MLINQSLAKVTKSACRVQGGSDLVVRAAPYISGYNSNAEEKHSFGAFRLRMRWFSPGSSAKSYPNVPFLDSSLIQPDGPEALSPPYAVRPFVPAGEEDGPVLRGGDRVDVRAVIALPPAENKCFCFSSFAETVLDIEAL